MATSGTVFTAEMLGMIVAFVCFPQ